MSASLGEPATGAPAETERPPSGNPAFDDLMGLLVEAEAGAAAAAGDVPGAAASDPAATPAGAPAAGEAATPAAPAAGGPGSAPAGTEGAAPGGTAGDAAQPGAGARPADWTATTDELNTQLGGILTSFEERTTQAYQQVALDEVREEHKPYFDALAKHPRLLVGTDVPAIGKEGNERLTTTADARDWQEAVKSILADEISERTDKSIEANKGFLDTIHASIQLFQNNPDLVPGGAKFDVDLANKFAEMAKPYELRVEGKLQGYAIPVQPLVDSLRAQVAASRAAAPAAPAGTPPAATPVDGPQAGIPSKAGTSTEVEDFSTFFGTLGLPNLRI